MRKFFLCFLMVLSLASLYACKKPQNSVQEPVATQEDKKTKRVRPIYNKMLLEKTGREETAGNYQPEDLSQTSNNIKQDLNNVSQTTKTQSDTQENKNPPINQQSQSQIQNQEIQSKPEIVQTPPPSFDPFDIRPNKQPEKPQSAPAQLSINRQELPKQANATDVNKPVVNVNQPITTQTPQPQAFQPQVSQQNLTQNTSTAMQNPIQQKQIQTSPQVINQANSAQNQVINNNPKDPFIFSGIEESQATDINSPNAMRKKTNDQGTQKTIPPKSTTKQEVFVSRFQTPADESTKYFLQAGSFAKKDIAEKKINELKTVVSPNLLFISEGDVNKKRYYRVQIGPFATEKEANTIFQNVIRAGHYDVYILRKKE